MTDDRDSTRHDAADRGDEFAEIGPAGVPFPGESEWLDAELPADLGGSDDFVQRTMHSLQDEGLAEAAPNPARELLRPEILAAFRAPAPSADFVDRTMQAVAKDRQDGFRDLLARHIAPTPSRQFVERTLRALGEDRRPRPPWSWAWPVLALAAAAIVWLLLQTDGTNVDPSRPIQPRRASPFAYSYSPTPLPAVLAKMSRRDDPDALPDASADGGWVFVGNVVGPRTQKGRRR